MAPAVIVKAMAVHKFSPTILREYDVRGIVGVTLSNDDARALGATIAGAADIDLGRILAEGAFDVAVTDLGTIGRLAGTGRGQEEVP